MMPSSKSSRSQAQHEFWPPTMMRFRPKVEHDNAEVDDLDLSRIDDNPLSYFLTPTTLPEHDERDDVMNFDAGIEDTKHPQPIVRSVSPSHLDGLRLPQPRSQRPPRLVLSLSPDLDYEMPVTPDEESYLRFNCAHTLPVPLSLKEYSARVGTGTSKTKARNYHHDEGDDDDRLSSSSGGLAWLTRAPSTGMAWGRPARLSPHSWREPSPAVWAIEEEREEAGGSSGSSSSSSARKSGVEEESAETQPLNIVGSKPKKRVRFALPGGKP